MSMLVKLEDEVKNLSGKELAEFRDWFLDYEAKRWDKQIEKDSKSGKLDSLAELAIGDFKDKKYKTI